VFKEESGVWKGVTVGHWGVGRGNGGSGIGLVFGFWFLVRGGVPIAKRWRKGR
jgi:hypothetical protein